MVEMIVWSLIAVFWSMAILAIVAVIWVLWQILKFINDLSDEENDGFLQELDNIGDEEQEKDVREASTT